MNVSGEHRVAAPREQVWQALHDPDILRVCIPGCEDVQAEEAHVFTGRMVARIGAVSTVFTGRLMLSDESFPKGWQVAAHAESPSAGWADGTASVRLTAVSGGTMVAYHLHVAPGGRLAAVGDRLLRGVAMRMASDFFTRLTEQLMPETQGSEPQDRSDPVAVPPRRKVLPLAPTPAPTTVAPAESAGPERMPRGQRIIITVGLAYCAFIWLSMGLALLHHL
ncbi:MAG: CoxG family protein [Bacteroidota bacterium]